MSTKYLDSTGLSYLWGKLKAYFQPKLVSGTNIKTINGSSILGSGDISVGIADLIYPVGSIYMSVNNANPGTLFGGTWVQLENRFLLGAGTSYTAGDTGGSEYIQEHGHDHTNPSVTGGSCTITSSGGHSHTITSYYKGSNAASGSARNTPNTGASSATNLATIASNTGTHTHSVPSHTHTVSGGSIDDVNGVQTGNEGNMPPYLVVYMWKRTA